MAKGMSLELASSSRGILESAPKQFATFGIGTELPLIYSRYLLYKSWEIYRLELSDFLSRGDSRQAHLEAYDTAP